MHTELPDGEELLEAFRERFQPTGADFAVAAIELGGAPYVREINGEPVSASRTLERLAEASAYPERLAETLERRREELEPLTRLGSGRLLERVRNWDNGLDFAEVYSAMTHVCAGPNKTLRAELGRMFPTYQDRRPDDLLAESVGLLLALSERETSVGFQPQELAGLVAAVVELDTVVRVKPESPGPVFALGGMGGDQGIPHPDDNGSKLKTSNVSTLAMAGLGRFGRMHKHHSYPNSSKVAGQSAVEYLGARSDFDTPEQMQRLLEETGMLASSCHSTRTVHTISHILRQETINHAIGPLAIPHHPDSPLLPLIGVNEKVHPATIVEALEILETRGVQRYEATVAFCAVDPDLADREDLLDPERYYQDPGLKQAVRLDEVGPPPYHTLAVFGTKHGRRAVIIAPEDFFEPGTAGDLTTRSVCIENTEESILAANRAVLDASDGSQTEYVAMTVALGLFARIAGEHESAFRNGSVDRDILRRCYREALDVFQSGEARETMEAYVQATHRFR